MTSATSTRRLGFPAPHNALNILRMAMHGPRNRNLWHVLQPRCWFGLAATALLTRLAYSTPSSLSTDYWIGCMTVSSCIFFVRYKESVTAKHHRLRPLLVNKPQSRVERNTTRRSAMQRNATQRKTTHVARQRTAPLGDVRCLACMLNIYKIMADDN